MGATMGQFWSHKVPDDVVERIGWEMSSPTIALFFRTSNTCPKCAQKIEGNAKKKCEKAGIKPLDREYFLEASRNCADRTLTVARNIVQESDNEGERLTCMKQMGDSILLLAGVNLYVVDIRTGELVKRIDRPGSQHPIHCLELLPEKGVQGPEIITSNSPLDEGIVAVSFFNFKSGDITETMNFHQTQGTILSIAHVPANKLLTGHGATTGHFKTRLTLWAYRTPTPSSPGHQMKQLMNFQDEHDDWLTDIKLVYRDKFATCSDEFATCSHDRTIRLWCFNQPKSKMVLEGYPNFEKGHKGWVSSIAVLHDERKLASVSIDHCVIVWDLESGGHIFTLEGHTAWVTSVISVKGVYGNRLFTASKDGTIRCWDIKKGKEEFQRVHTTTIDFEPCLLCLSNNCLVVTYGRNVGDKTFSATVLR